MCASTQVQSSFARYQWPDPNSKRVGNFQEFHQMTISITARVVQLIPIGIASEMQKQQPFGSCMPMWGLGIYSTRLFQLELSYQESSLTINHVAIKQLPFGNKASLWLMIDNGQNDVISQKLITSQFVLEPLIATVSDCVVQANLGIWYLPSNASDLFDFQATVRAYCFTWHNILIK